jgi:ribosomal protein S18 acetylase RimI-like enzyme
VTPITALIERSYDAIPRVGGAEVESVGPFDLFLKGSQGVWPLYARPRLGVNGFRRSDVDAVRARQRELGVPEAIEWVAEASPDLLGAVRASGMPIVFAPLMVLDPDRLPDPASLTDAELVLLDPDSAEFVGLYAAGTAVASLGFSAAGTAIGPAGPAARDTALGPVETLRLERAAEGFRTGRTCDAIARTVSEGVLAHGAYQGAGGAAELVGIVTLPAARRRGLGAAISAFVARHALERGYDLIFLGAADENVARVYSRVGFSRVGTACIAQLT